MKPLVLVDRPITYPPFWRSHCSATASGRRRRGSRGALVEVLDGPQDSRFLHQLVLQPLQLLFVRGPIL